MIRASTLSLMILLVGCASSPLTEEFLDPETSVTVSYTHTPIVLFIDRSGRAAFARDYLNIGPIQINQQGRQRHFLWAGIWTTLEANAIDDRADGFELLTIYADGEPILLDVAGWTPTAVGATRSIYTKPVSSAVDAYYEVTIDQIRMIATANNLRIQTSGEPGVSYELWDTSESAKRGFREFLARVSD